MKYIGVLIAIGLIMGCTQPLDEIVKEAVQEAIEETAEPTETPEPEEAPEATPDEPTSEPAAEEPAAEPESIPEAEPSWTAEPGYIYLYPEDVEPDGTNYAKLYIAEPGKYDSLYAAAKLKMEDHNQEYPDNPWIIIGGGP